MQYRSAKGYTGWGQTGILFAFVGVGLILAAIIQLAIIIVAAGGPVLQKGDAMLKALYQPENLVWLQLSQVLGTFFLMFLPVAAYSLLCNGKSALWLGFSKRFDARQVILGFLIIFCANIVAQPLQEFSKFFVGHFPSFDRWAKQMEDAYNEQVIAISHLKGIGSLITAIFITAFFPALFEEMFFRGAVQNLLIRWWNKPILGIIVASIIFSFVHGEVYPFLSRIILGFALGMLYWQSKNIWVNVIAHFLNNSLFLVQLYVQSNGKEKFDLYKSDEHFPVWIQLVSIVIFYFLFVLFKRVSAKKRAQIEMDEQKLWIKSTPQYNLADSNPNTTN